MSVATFAAGAWVDELLDVVFGGVAGAEGVRRLAPLVAEHDARVGVLHEDDVGFAALHAARGDWALCDAPIDGVVGDTWARRAAARAEHFGVDPERASAVAGSVLGLFEVWPGSPVRLRDRLSGLSVSVLDPLGPWADAEGPAALWELRIVRDGDGVRLARPPIDYPLDLLAVLEERAGDQFVPGQALSVLDLRRARLRWLRSGKRRSIELML